MSEETEGINTPLGSLFYVKRCSACWRGGENEEARRKKVVLTGGDLEKEGRRLLTGPGRESAPGGGEHTAKLLSGRQVRPVETD